jgi:hypothetical protein
MSFASVSELLDSLAPPVEVEQEAWDDVLARAELLGAAPAQNGRVGGLAKGLSELRMRSRAAASSRQRRALVLVAVVLLALALVVATAYALGYNVINFAGAPTAPAPVIRDFSSFSEGAPPGMDPQAIASETRRLGEIDGSQLSVGPTKAGGFCFEWSHSTGGCEALGPMPLVVTWMSGRVAAQPELGLNAQPWANAIAVYVDVGTRWADAVELRLDDGSTVHPDIVWVSAPINAGFFLYRAPAGRTVATVFALRGGEVVAAEGKDAPSGPHPFADVSKRRRIAEVETSRGPVTLWTAPTKTDERCSWLAFQRREIAVASCLPPAYARQTGLGARMRVLGGRSIFAGSCGYRAVQFVHRDGRFRTVDCIDGLVFADLKPADTAGGIRALGANGHVVLREPGPLAPPPGHRRFRLVYGCHRTCIKEVPVPARRQPVRP